MQSFCRALAASLLLVLLTTGPASAAPVAAATAEPHLSQVTLAAGGPMRNTLLWVRTSNVDPATDVRLEVTADLGGATTFADVEFDSSSPDNTAVNEVDPEQPCRRTGELVSCSWTTRVTSNPSLEIAALLAVTPKKTAKAGDSAGLTLTARIGDGPVGTSTSLIQVGEGVDLAAGQDLDVKAGPGKSVKITPAVRNAGAIVVDGVALVVAADPRLLGPSSYRNCRYGAAVICTFDTQLEPGRAYALATPITLRSPADTVPGSVVPVAQAWTTSTEWEEGGWGEFGTPGTGAPLTLEPVATSQGTPQADVREENNFSTTTFTVTGSRRPALVAVGVRLTAAVGDQVTLAPGMTNFGPGTLRPDLFPNNRLGIAVRPPGNVEVTDDTACQYDFCVLDHDLAAGQKATFPITVTVTGECGDQGRVEVPARLPDLDGESSVAKNVSPLSVSVPGATCVALPITGARAGWTALAGLVLIAGGVLLMARRTR